jgi:FMN-dependent NADH-azoreductase
MPRLLHLDSSADTTRSTSRELTRAFADAWRALGPSFDLTYRDLHADPVPHLAASALHWAPRLRHADEAPDPRACALQDQLIAELLAADVLLVGAPMYNWSIPSSLKAWIDHVHVMGLTAPFDTKEQPLAGRPAVVVTTRGASYGPGSPSEGWDHTVPPIERVFGQSLGMDVSIISAELTLASRVPAMAPLRDKARADLEAARTAATDLAVQLGRRLLGDQ